MEEIAVSLPHLALSILIAVGTIFLTDFLQELIMFKNKDFLALIKNIKNLEQKIKKEESKQTAEPQQAGKLVENKKVK